MNHSGFTFITIDGAARLLNVSPSTVLRMVASGTLEAVNADDADRGAWRIRLADVYAHAARLS